VFCGVGPFSLYCWSHKNCSVYANDLNPHCFHYLKQNLDLNKVPNNKINPFNMDGGEFIKYLLERVDEDDCHIDHFYMNLPALNIEFLTFFR